jgi:preprotein translocase subunit YajC
MLTIVIWFAFIVLVFFLLIVRPQRRRVAAHRTFVDSLEVGDDVITSGGIYGTVLTLDEDRVVLQVAPGVELTVARAAIAQSAVPPEAPAANGDDHTADNGPTDD